MHMRAILLLCALLTSALQAQTPAEAPTLTIVHTNDTHSQIEPIVNAATGEAYGGVVERASLIEYLREQDPEMLYLDCGDQVQGSPYFNVYKGELEMLCMNQQQLLAATLGNHEFDNSLEGLRFMQRTAQFPYLSCNYHCERTPIAQLVQPHLITQSHGVKIGITGVTCSPEGLIARSHWQGIEFEDPITAVNREARLLRDEGCDLVIVLSHLGYEKKSSPGAIYDADLARASHDVDIILGGHSHTNIEHGLTLPNAEGHPVCITQTGGKANRIGYVNIAMRQGSRYAGCQYSVDSIVCSKLTAADYDLTAYGEDIRQLVEPYRESLAAQMESPVGSATRTMEKGSPQSQLGNFTADALMDIGYHLTGSRIDIGLMNIGGLRNDFLSGTVSIGQIYEVFPFDNAIVVLSLYGHDLRDLILNDATGRINAWGGVQLTLDPQRQEGSIVTDILVGGQPIDPDRLYNICTLDYLAEGNNGMTALRRATHTVTTNVFIRDAMIDHVNRLSARHEPLSAIIDGRVMDTHHHAIQSLQR